MSKNTYAFIDAANLMYGGKKSLGWSVDHKKLLKYLRDKYRVSKAYYYAGVDLCGMQFDPLVEKDIDLLKLQKHISELAIDSVEKHKHLQSVKFYIKLSQFGYILCLKPVKIFKEGSHITKKANCDVDMTFDLMRYIPQYNKAIILSGDGDFFAVLKYLSQEEKKKILVMSRAERTAKEIKRLAAGSFVDFHYLKYILKYEEIKERHPSRMPLTSVKKIVSNNKVKIKKT